MFRPTVRSLLPLRRSYHHIIPVLPPNDLMPAAFTALNDDHTINYEVIPPCAKFLADNGMKSILVIGTTGEGTCLTLPDRKKMVDEWVKAGKTYGLHIQVQVGGACLPNVLELAGHCQAVGADSILCLPELYFKPGSVSELVQYLGLVANAAPKLPLVYYHTPLRTGVAVDMVAFVKEATANIPSFKGLKFNTSDLSEAARVMRAMNEDQTLYISDETLLAPAALLGVKSFMATTFTLFPRLAQDIKAAVQNNDVTRARTLQEKLSLAVEALIAEGPWVPVMKYGMEIVTGLKMGPPCLPQTDISAEAKQRIQERLRSLGLAK